MSADFNKNGIITCTPMDGYDKVSIMKNDIAVGENLVKGMYQSYRTNTSSTTYGSLTCILSREQIKALAGQKVTFSYYYSIEGDRINGSHSTLGNRFGIHSQLNCTKTGGTSTTTFYPFANYLTASGTGIAVMTWTIPSVTSIDSDWMFALQCSGGSYARPADTNITWCIKNVKLEIGEKATPWCPSPADNFGSTPSTYKNPIQAKDFIEL